MADAADPLFDHRLRELASALEELAHLLLNNGAQDWSTWVERILSDLKRYDAGTLDRLLGAYRGMGSFNDLVVGSWSPGPTPTGVREANDRLAALRERCYTLASYLRGELRRP
ncbi:DUF6966 domain-containing protein [Micromonospora musae]|uniref:DUF6966 domain-containing protein n=1 Tax=Micromonospora musae TaxID=1894970 RepID=UPI003414A829